MKKILLVLAGVLVMFGLFGCDKKNQQNQSTTPVKTIEVTITNKIKKADIWIIHDTEKNRNTTVWGTATIKELGAEESKKATIEASSDNAYLLRIIDDKQMYYAANNILLADNQTIVIISGDNSMTAIAQVYDANGNKIAEYNMSVARL